MSTWLSAGAVIPQLRQEWSLSPSESAWLTIAVQLGFVCGAIVAGVLNLSDIVAPKHVILGASLGAAAANSARLSTADSIHRPRTHCPSSHCWTSRVTGPISYSQ